VRWLHFCRFYPYLPLVAKRGVLLDRLETWIERPFVHEATGLHAMGLPRSSAWRRRTARFLFCPSPVFGGLDWAMSSDETTPSYTKIGLWAVVNGKMHLIFGHSFVGLGASDPDLILRQVSGWMELFDVNALGVDYGVGYKEDLRLMDRHPGKILIFHYTGAVVPQR
jgi:hypothetical protein